MGNDLVIYTERVRERIRAVAISEAELPEEVANDVAFHMTDWLVDLQDFHSFCSEPEALSNEALGKLLMQFLVHVPNHLAAASKLYMNIPVTDVFEVGAITEDE
jgi:hypothetical protein